MKKYYCWFEDLTDYGFPFIQITRLELKDINEWDLIIGKKIKDWDPENTAYYEDDGVANDLLCTTMLVHIISERLMQLLQSLDLKGVQYLPLHIEKEDGSAKLKNYYVLNVDHRINCLDLMKSDYLLWGHERNDRQPDELRDLRKAVLIRSKIGGDRIFRLAEWDVYLVVDEQIKNAINQMKLTGSEFQKLEITER